MEQHSKSINGAMTEVSGTLKKRGCERNIDDVVDNGFARQRVEREIKLRLARHAEGRGIHQEIDSRHRLGCAMPVEGFNGGTKASSEGAGAINRAIA